MDLSPKCKSSFLLSAWTQDENSAHALCGKYVILSAALMIPFDRSINGSPRQALVSTGWILRHSLDLAKLSIYKK